MTLPEDIGLGARLEEGDLPEAEITPDGILLRPQLSSASPTARLAESTCGHRHEPTVAHRRSDGCDVVLPAEQPRRADGRFDDPASAPQRECRPGLGEKFIGDDARLLGSIPTASVKSLIGPAGRNRTIGDSASKLRVHG